MTIVEIKPKAAYEIEKGPSREQLFDILRIGVTDMLRSRIILTVLVQGEKKKIIVSVEGVMIGNNDRVPKESNVWIIWGEVKKQDGFRRPRGARKGVELYFMAHLNTKNRKGKLVFRGGDPRTNFVPLELAFLVP